MSYLLNYSGWKKVYEAANGQIPSSELNSIPTLPAESGEKHSLNPVAAEAYSKMVAAAKADGITWGITDSYRTLDVQQRLVKEKGLYSQGGLAAKPGTSNHGWGSAVDLDFKQGSGTAAQEWLKNNAANFGFSTIPREPWHWEHKESAKLVQSGQTGGPAPAQQTLAQDHSDEIVLTSHQERLVKLFVSKMQNDDSINNLIDNKEDLVNVAPEELEKLAANLNIEESILELWISDQIEDSDFIEIIARNLVTSGLSRRERKETIQTVAPVAQLADVASGQKLLKLGSKGDDVKVIQQKLYDLGFMEEEPSGSFDQETDAAVREFQTSKNIGVDGIVGPITYSQLYGTKPPQVTYSGGADFESVAKSVVADLEGGYYHPSMMQKNPGKFSAYGKSGETMFGLDRFAGHDLYYSTPLLGKNPIDDLQYIESGKYQYKSDAAREFWETIDKADAKNKWSWNYMGGADNSKLVDLAGQIMKPYFEKLFSTKLTPEAQALVKQSPALMYHFIYGTWNGPDWFRKFADDINTAVASGTTDLNVLARVAIDSRTKEGRQKGSAPNALVARGGEKMQKMFSAA